MNKLWNKDQERAFFKESLKKFSNPEKLFYLTEDNRYVAYWPKGYNGKKTTLQSRNSLVGNYTEKFAVDILQNHANENGWYAIQGVICNELGLTSRSPADVGFCDTKTRKQNPENIHALFEVKMSLVWNWEYFPDRSDNKLVCLGDYKSHTGNPGLLRSDSMLKAIGKSINIRVSGINSSHIPIIILGNTPITSTYFKKADHLKNFGVIQGFWSLNPEPLEASDSLIESTPKNGYIKFDSYNKLKKLLTNLVESDLRYFSSMLPKKELGKMINIANKEKGYEKKAEKFLQLLRSNNVK